ncbi:permease of the drug/metabolite transporter [Thermosipho africanus H17ap60334]|jgi:drug/metabolite transporter (DMT)-like permease|uniref:Permease of the drug/metabolite transporter, putative n=1 Tax=Thermosipho africanus (strain TCF52B) TaxID=484019 RepID=B7IH78_THEAB|nr:MULTISPECIES: EamA family transporter [Thermosipho]ACJ75442.1 permease of the drug/metabolite transporter, putative [Thermosipho africanus TCF52B]EKF50100.1 permease of the drug/metabolite transporter [Thermosipho africanus H17ap60334]MBZ4650880.1 putative permease of the drug/metabolite transporter [Thermosipho sp. (in: thermotogales)]MDK2900804.1 hypothetical protein [Thermosipho sp. (in: thermotogales)]RDI90241.1 permease of the drug/metabolite transporter [Thermosipho africanus Ob7]
MIYAILSAVLMGSTAIFNKFALKDFDPMFATVINSLLAGIFSLFFLKKFQKINMYVIFVGLFNAVGLLFMFMGLSKLDPGIAMVLGTSYYIFTSLYSVLLFKEKISMSVFFQIAVNIFGIILIIMPSYKVENLNLVGGIFSICSALFFATSNSVAKLSKIQADFLVFANNIITFLVISILYFSIYGTSSLSFSLRGFIFLTIASFIGSFLGLYFFYKSLSKIGFSIANIVRTLNPITSLLLSRLFFPNVITMRQWIGIIIVIFSIYRLNVLINRTKVELKKA